MFKVRFSAPYRPLYLLSAVGVGGLCLTFYTYLLFLTPHPGSPLPTLSTLTQVYSSPSFTPKMLVTLALTMMIILGIRHYVVLAANLRLFFKNRSSKTYALVRTSDAEVTLIALPFALAMSVNVAFAFITLFVPRIEAALEWVYLGVLVAFTAISALAFFIFGRYVTRVIASQNFKIKESNHFSQILPTLAFSLIAFGFGATAAMSDKLALAMAATFGSFLALSTAILWALIMVPISFSAILRQGLPVEAGPTLWIGIPIVGLIGAALVRLGVGISHNLAHAPLPPVAAFTVLGLLLSFQLTMGALGWAVMRQQKYFARFVWGNEKSVASYGLITPGVGLIVLLLFFIHTGLIGSGLVHPYSPVHLTTLACVFALQLRTLQTLYHLDRKLLRVDAKEKYSPAHVSESELCEA